MKTKIITILSLLLIVLASCSTPQYTIGMTETEFKKHNHNAELVAANEKTTVYRISKVVMTWTPGAKFYYFTNGLLARIDVGVRNPDILIQNTH